MICAFIAEWRWVKVHRDLGRLNLEDPDPMIRDIVHAK